MKLLLQFLRQKKWSIGVVILFFAIYFVFFALFRLPLEAVVYPSALCLICGTLYLGLRFWRFSQIYHALLRCKELSFEQMEHLPPPTTANEAVYQDIIAALRNEICDLMTKSAAEYQEAADYYTLWAHQIKTPIAAMKLLLRQEDSTAARTLSSELLRIEQYVEMVMTYLRLESPQSDFVFCSCAIDPIIRQSVRRFSSEFISRKIRLDYQPSDAKTVTDAKWFAFVLEQILSNALKYTAEGSICITVKADTLQISDTGIGIAPEDLPRVFEKGYTGYNGRKDMRASGIGLFLCKRICEKLGIRIGISSRLDRGTTVTLSLPQQKPMTE